MSSKDRDVRTGDENTTPFDFDRALADIKRAAEVLARPEAKETVQAIQDAVKAVAAVQDAVKAVAVQDAVKAVAVQDALRAVAVVDAAKAVAVQDAVKAVALATSEIKDMVRTSLSEEVARAVEMIRSAAENASRKS
jgi:hypothetical protein